ncbi:hypothetical protein CEXT_211601 [Caerostris extrusa]|uniref:Uncharacterized protein n=1 Tax=Caerostris extrusa TaxID=172846 RepID=A0AAV4PY68_CAEEX|nr:hypothetical protein CEXT_211601 [Caerostris extrusa]
MKIKTEGAPRKTKKKSVSRQNHSLKKGKTKVFHSRSFTLRGRRSSRSPRRRCKGRSWKRVACPPGNPFLPRPPVEGYEWRRPCWPPRR